MNIIFANDTLAKLRFLALSDETGSGFLCTERVGKYILITDMITGNISRDSVTNDMVNIYGLWGTGFGGIFIKGDHDTLPEYFVEKLVVKISGYDYKIFHYKSDSHQNELITEGSLSDH